jgi:hypothetical protein
MTEIQATPRPVKTLRWIARVWSLLLLLLALAVTLTPPMLDGTQAPAPVPEPTPVIEYVALGAYALAVLGLLLAWRWELVGGIISILGVILHDILFYISVGFAAQYLAGNLIVGLAFILPAALFITCWILACRRQPIP